MNIENKADSYILQYHPHPSLCCSIPLLHRNMHTFHTVLWLFSFSLNAQTKRALVIGIGKQEDSSWNMINGDKDVPYVLEMLKNANYEQIITCVNEKATKAGILAAFQTLTQSCKSDDIVYIHYSGHGQQMKDVGNDEVDALDECWIPYDAYRKPSDKYRGEKHLVDDEINVLLTNICDKIGDGGKILVVVDACFSGGSTRTPTGEVKDEIIRGADESFMKAPKYLKDKKILKILDKFHNRWITLTACENSQVNAEMVNPKVGKLTYAIHNIIVKNQFSGNNDEFMEKLKNFIKLRCVNTIQRPTITGKIEHNIVDILR